MEGVRGRYFENPYDWIPREDTLSKIMALAISIFTCFWSLFARWSGPLIGTPSWFGGVVVCMGFITYFLCQQDVYKDKVEKHHHDFNNWVMKHGKQTYFHWDCNGTRNDYLALNSLRESASTFTSISLSFPSQFYGNETIEKIFFQKFDTIWEKIAQDIATSQKLQTLVLLVYKTEYALLAIDAVKQSGSIQNFEMVFRGDDPRMNRFSQSDGWKVNRNSQLQKVTIDIGDTSYEPLNRHQGE